MAGQTSTVESHSTPSYCENSEYSIVLRVSHYSIVLRDLTALFRGRASKYCRTSQVSIVLRELRVLNLHAIFTVLDRPLSFCLSSQRRFRMFSRGSSCTSLCISFSESSRGFFSQKFQREFLRLHRDPTMTLQRLYRDLTETP